MHSVSRRSGRISFVVVAGICSAALVAFLFMFSGSSPRVNAAEFMSALVKGDVNRLTELSIVQNKSPDEIRKEWNECVKYGADYSFAWDIISERFEGDTATIKLDITKDPQNQASYAEHYELSMVKVNGTWKVDVPQIARDMFPNLPQ